MVEQWPLKPLVAGFSPCQLAPFEKPIKPLKTKDKYNFRLEASNQKQSKAMGLNVPFCGNRWQPAGSHLVKPSIPAATRSLLISKTDSPKRCAMSLREIAARDFRPLGS